ncbi:MAG: Hsp20/alpha crystallin family protein [Firmicutes bacterium]|nr:Hsp20/alpha crystallin family protein [Bacillota bacterium]
MSIIRNDAFPKLDNLKRDLDKFFTEFPKYVSQELSGPRVDVYETENEVVASCEIPGIENKEDIYVNVEDNILTISGVINKVHEVKEEELHRRERYQGQFQRTIRLPSPVTDNARAKYKNGVLEVRLTKVQPEPKKGIDIEFN